MLPLYQVQAHLSTPIGMNSRITGKFFYLLHGYRLASETPIIMIGMMMMASMAIVMMLLVMCFPLLLVMISLYYSYRHLSRSILSNSQIISYPFVLMCHPFIEIESQSHINHLLYLFIFYILFIRFRKPILLSLPILPILFLALILSITYCLPCLPMGCFFVMLPILSYSSKLPGWCRQN